MSIGVQVGQLRVIALVRFVNQLVWFAKQLNLSQKAIESAKKSAQDQATAAVTAVSQSMSFGLHLNMGIVFAYIIMLVLILAIWEKYH